MKPIPGYVKWVSLLFSLNTSENRQPTDSIFIRNTCILEMKRVKYISCTVKLLILIHAFSAYVTVKPTPGYVKWVALYICLRRLSSDDAVLTSR